jgi:hypothetical protein
MKKIIIAFALVLATSAFAETTSGTKQQQETTVVTGSAAQSSNSGVTQNITFAATDNSSAAREAGAADVQVALINSEAAKVIAGTTQTIKNTPSVSGPNLTTSNDTCMGSTSGSLNIAGLGFGGGTSWVDDNCKMLKNSRELWNMGMKAASLALMCTDKANKEALEITGFICPQTAAARKAEDDAKATELKLKSTDTLSLAK